MLELPESHNMAEQLTQTVQGLEIVKVTANHSPHGFAFYFGDPKDYADLLCGKVLGKTHAIAGQVELCVQDMRIVLGDGVNIRFLAQGETPPKKHQLLLELQDGTAIVCTVQMYGQLMAFPDGANRSPYYLVAKEKPTPLTSDFDMAYFTTLVDSVQPSMSAKAFLATQQRIPGLGNGVLQDILFRAGIHPRSKLSALEPDWPAKLFQSVKETLYQMTIQGGRDTERDLFGCSGGYQTILSSKTLSNPCPVCGGEILRQAYLGGNVYVCPACQPKK